MYRIIFVIDCVDRVFNFYLWSESIDYCNVQWDEFHKYIGLAKSTRVFRLDNWIWVGSIFKILINITIYKQKEHENNLSAMFPSITKTTKFSIFLISLMYD